ncbi:hypothetical protein V6N11_055357 [Hibiscus sabdariffa]|uniref:Uncharacterized protein n=1 Tax=Hibiscus sabdariffa TaxID=183260 RepID=A0ABR2PF35_9ROSI
MCSHALSNSSPMSNVAGLMDSHAACPRCTQGSTRENPVVQSPHVSPCMVWSQALNLVPGVMFKSAESGIIPESSHEVLTTPAGSCGNSTSCRNVGNQVAMPSSLPITPSHVATLLADSNMPV